jgi:CHAT domain-containing protein
VALKLGRALGDKAVIAQATTNIGETYYSSGDFKKAIELQEAALNEWHELNDSRGQSQALVALGYCYTNLAEPKRALELFDQAVALSRSINDLRGEASALVALSFLKVKVSEPQQALDVLNRARELIERIGDQTSLATVIGRVGVIYFGLGNKEKALEFTTEGTRLFELGDEKWGAAECQLLLGRIHHAFGEDELALKYMNEAGDRFRSLSMPRLEAQALQDIGLVYSSLNDNQKAIDAYQHSMKLLRPGQDQQRLAYTLNYIGRSYENEHDYKTAIDYYDRALPLSRVASDQAAEILTLHNLAHVEHALRNLDAAREKIEASLALTESFRARVVSQDLRASYFATVRQNYELYIEVLMMLHKMRPAEGFDAAAFGVSERARARSLLETLQEAQTNIREGVDTSLLDREKTLQAELNLKAERQLKLTGSPEKAEADKVAHEINSLTTELAAVRDQIKSTSPRYAALTAPQPLDVHEVQQRLIDDDSILLEYALADERSYVWVVSRTAMSTYELGSRTEIEESAKRLYANLVAYQAVPGQTVEQNEERRHKADESIHSETALLSKLILGPLAGTLGNKRLVIIPDGALQYIPFQALLDPDANSSAPRFLLAGHEIVNEPSASTLSLLLTEAKQRKPAPDSVAVVADPVFEVDDPRVKRASQAATPESAETQRVKQALRDVGISADGVQIPRLYSSGKEADAIMSYAPWGTGLKAVGFAANRDWILGKQLANYRIVHFATHGLINNEHPELSGIVFSLFDQQGRGQDGFLRLHDIYNLHLPADLVVLSACSTGLGKDVRGEGLIGLTRGFMYAGASGVVASLWKVDDEATAELMERFYAGLFQKGLSPAAALKEAQLTMSQQKRWQSPYYWAGFVLQGRYDEQVAGNSLSYLTPRRVAIPVALLAGLLLVIFLVVRRRRARII